MGRDSLKLIAVAGALLVFFGGLSAAGAVTNPATGTASAEMSRMQSDLPVGVRIGYGRIMVKLRENPATRRVRGGRGDMGVATILIADVEGRPYYYLPPGSECTDACLRDFRPAAALAGAKEVGGFTIVNGRWLFQGKPLFVALAGPKLSDPLKIDDGHAMVPEFDHGLEITEGQNGMKLLRLDPKSWTKMPFSIGVAEYRLAPGLMLAAGVAGNNPMGAPLYAFSGSLEQEKALPAMFKPQYAAALSLPMGDFTIRERDDGTRQWLYRGAALFTCSCDISAGSLNGEGVVAGMAPAMMVRYFLPKEVVLKRDSVTIGRMVEATTGKTLYYRYRLVDFYVPDNARPMLGIINAQVAAGMGTTLCDAKCEKEYEPLWAPKDAQPGGYWSIYERTDGKRQWAYKNAAVYTHVNEGPGSLDGDEKFLVEFEDGHGGKALPNEFGMGLAWRALTP